MTSAVVMCARIQLCGKVFAGVFQVSRNRHQWLAYATQQAAFCHSIGPRRLRVNKLWGYVTAWPNYCRHKISIGSYLPFYNEPPWIICTHSHATRRNNADMQTKQCILAADTTLVDDMCSAPCTTPLPDASLPAGKEHVHARKEGEPQTRAVYARQLENARASRRALAQIVANIEEMRAELAALLEEGGAGPSADDLRADIAGWDRDIATARKSVAAKDHSIAQLEGMGNEYGW